MAYNTKNIIRDAAGAPVPQFYNPASDTYEALQGRNGANRVELYGPDGNPIGTTSGKLNVRASEIEALAGALTDAAVTDPATSASIIALLKGLLKQLQGNGPVKDQVDVVDRAARALGKITADDNAIAALGALAAAAVTDPAASASVIALLKGLLKQLQGAGTGAAPVQLTGSTVTNKIIANQNEIYSSISILIKQNEPRDIYGASWNKGSEPILTRTDAAVGKTANAGVGLASAANDFDNLPIWGEIEEVMDEYGNYFIRIPKFYIRKLDGANFKSWQVSKHRHPGFYLPWVFWDFTNKRELPYYDHGKYKASKDGYNRLESKPDKYPLVNTNIVDFRTYARNNNANGLVGYQQLDIHAVDAIRTLMFIEFATLDIQSVMQGFTTGQYNSAHTATVAENNTNRIIVANATADLYRVGQSISVGTSLGGNQIFYGRTITSIDVYDASNKAISFDGTPVNIAVGNILYNTGWKNGFSRSIAASSGSLTANDGKYPCAYRGIESPFGDIWQFVDGVNINEFQAWVAENANDYVSNVFADPYKILGYINHNANGYVSAMGFDPNYPFAEFPTAVAGSSSTYYSDYYYQNTGQRIALFGADWSGGGGAGVSCWNLSGSSASAGVSVGGRLLKKPL